MRVHIYTYTYKHQGTEESMALHLHSPADVVLSGKAKAPIIF
jgi:hypothetical protein